MKRSKSYLRTRQLRLDAMKIARAAKRAGDTEQMLRMVANARRAQGRLLVATYAVAGH